MGGTSELERTYRLVSPRLVAPSLSPPGNNLLVPLVEPGHRTTSHLRGTTVAAASAATGAAAMAMAMAMAMTLAMTLATARADVSSTHHLYYHHHCPISQFHIHTL
jgi:hypothetical protein